MENDIDFMKFSDEEDSVVLVCGKSLEIYQINLENKRLDLIIK